MPSTKRHAAPGAPETRGAPQAPPPVARPLRGAAIHPAPRKAELGLHRVAIPPRPPPTREEIARRAYHLWLQSGCAPGREDENWLQAERELTAGCS